MSTTRLYEVSDAQAGAGATPRLVEATSISAAIRHCALDHYSAAIAKPKTVADLMARGVKVEQAKPDLVSAAG